MAKEEEKSPVEKIVNDLAVPIYNDLLQPAAKEVGKALTTVGRTANIALAPLRGLVWSYERFEDWLVSRVEPHFAQVDASEISSPDLAIAGPLVNAIKFVSEDATLADMYAKLLATAMINGQRKNAHPSFVQIIGQLTQDEAKIISHVYKNGPTPIVLPILVDRKNSRSKTYRSRFSFLPFDAGCLVPDDFQLYLDNLSRLQIVDYFDDGELNEQASEYERILSLAPLQKILSQKESDDHEVVSAKGHVTLSVFGARFAKACIP